MIPLEKLMQLSADRLKYVNPIVRAGAVELIKRAHAAGMYIFITQGLREIEYQNSLYRKGRALIGGSWKVVKQSEVVTDAPGGSSYHNYELAVDVGGWDGNKLHYNIDWPKLRQIGMALGFEKLLVLRNGTKDWPHFQMSFGLSINDLKAGKKPPEKLEKKVAAPQVTPDPIRIIVNGKPEAWGSAIDGETWVPARQVGIALGATIGWDGDNVMVNSEPLPTRVIGGRGYVPVRELAKAAGVNPPAWNGKTKTVTLTT